MRTKPLVLLGVGMIAVALGLLVYSSAVTQDRIAASKAVDENHCPDCGRELPKGAAGECPFCKMLQVGAGKGPGAATGRRFTRTDYVLFFLIVFLACGGGYLIFRSTDFKSRRKKREEPAYYTRCPHCKRKVRYVASQVGRIVLCPTCRYTLTLTPPRS
jgi:Zn finger protein HypA/HybF involved in hydrogenase expression